LSGAWLLQLFQRIFISGRGGLQSSPHFEVQPEAFAVFGGRQLSHDYRTNVGKTALLILSSFKPSLIARQILESRWRCRHVAQYAHRTKARLEFLVQVRLVPQLRTVAGISSYLETQLIRSIDWYPKGNSLRALVQVCHAHIGHWEFALRSAAVDHCHRTGHQESSFMVKTKNHAIILKRRDHWSSCRCYIVSQTYFLQWPWYFGCPATIGSNAQPLRQDALQYSARWPSAGAIVNSAFDNAFSEGAAGYGSSISFTNTSKCWWRSKAVEMASCRSLSFRQKHIGGEMDRSQQASSPIPTHS
jgi:hypothetical protein